jgi:hypothetical protein
MLVRLSVTQKASPLLLLVLLLFPFNTPLLPSPFLSQIFFFPLTFSLLSLIHFPSSSALSTLARHFLRSLTHSLTLYAASPHRVLIACFPPHFIPLVVETSYPCQAPAISDDHFWIVLARGSSMMPCVLSRSIYPHLCCILLLIANSRLFPSDPSPQSP